MNKDKLIAWLTRVSNDLKDLYEIKKLNNDEGEEFSDIVTLVSGVVQICNVEEICKLLDIKFGVEDAVFNDSVYKSRLTFVFNGVRFSGLSTKEVTDFE